MKKIIGRKYAKAVATVLTLAVLTALLGIGGAVAAAAVRPAGTDGHPATAQAAGAAADVTQFGADGGDQADDTAAIQAVLDGNDSVYIPDGTYYINVAQSLRLRSGQTLTLGAGAVLQALPTSAGYYNVILISGAKDVVVTGGQIVGERASHSGSSGEWGMGIGILDSERVSVINVMVSDCWGDGIYVGGDGQPSRDITIDDVICDNNRRQGLSVTYAAGVDVTNSVFKNTNGTAPAAGIDIEPNDNEVTEDISITNTVCTGNEGAGLDLMGWMERVTDVAVSGCTFSDNGASGIRIVNAGLLRFENVDVTGNETGIDIQRDAADIGFVNVNIQDNSHRGVSLVTTSQSLGTSNIVFEKSSFHNNSRGSANNQDGIRIDNWDESAAIRSVTFKDCKFYDDQSSGTQRYGLTVGFGGGIYGVVVESSCTFYGNVTGDYLGGDALQVL
jgi:polygalacturonase